MPIINMDMTATVGTSGKKPQFVTNLYNNQTINNKLRVIQH